MATLEFDQSSNQAPAKCWEGNRLEMMGEAIAQDKESKVEYECVLCYTGNEVEGKEEIIPGKLNLKTFEATYSKDGQELSAKKYR